MEMGIYKALAAITSEIGAIAKDKRCQQGASFNYRGIDDVYNALNPLLGKYGVFVLPLAGERSSEERKTKNGAHMTVVTMRMTYRFCHEDGSSVECQTVGEAMDSGDKATNKAMAVAHKYAILQTFCIPTEDMEDPDAQAIELTPREKKVDRERLAEVRKAARENNPSPASDPQRKKLFAMMHERHGNNRDAILAELADFFGRPIQSSNELSAGEVSSVIDAMQSGQLEEVF